MSATGIDEKVYELLWRLEGRTLTGIDAIDEIVGLRLLATSTVHHTVILELIEEQLMDITTLISRYPPYEPLALSKVSGVPVKGTFVWLIRPQNFRCRPRFSELKRLTNSVSDLIIATREEPHYIVNGVIIYHVMPIRLLQHRINTINMRIYVRDRYRYFFIKYGSRVLPRVIRDLRLKVKDIKKVEHEIQRTYERRTGKRYDPLNLTYVWYCRLGIGISTDPWDVTCPFTRACILGERCRGKKWWSWRRRIFPKIYTTREVHIVGDTNLMYELSPLFKVFSISNAKTTVKLPYSLTQVGEIIYRPVIIKFERPIAYVLERTNALRFVFNKDLIRSILRFLLNKPINPAPLDGKLKRKPAIMDLITTKMFLYKEGLLSLIHI